MAYVTVGSCPYDLKKDAQAVLAGYSFGKQDLAWTSPSGPLIGLPPAASIRAAWAYRSYDCVPPSPGDLSADDVTVTAAINSKVTGAAVLGVLAVAPEVSEALARVPSAQTFWDLPLADVTALPTAGTAAWWVWRAWFVLMGVPGVDVAVSHKILHHKRPWLFPLLDGVTIGAYPPGGAWAGIHEELTEQRDTFEELEGWFAGLANAKGGVPLTLLRLHDILLWCERTGQRGAAHEAGRLLLDD